MRNGKPIIIRLGDVTAHLSSGATPRGGESVYLNAGPVMLVRSQNVRMNELDLGDVAFITEAINAEMKRSVVEPDDVLLNITGASIGRVARFGLRDVRANVNQHVCIIRPKQDRLDSRFLTYFISSSEVQHDINHRHQHGGTRQALTFAQINEFEIPLPPLSEQKRIADILDKADAIRRKRQEAGHHATELFTAAFIDRFGDPVINSKNWERVALPDVTKRITVGIVVKPASYYVNDGVPALRSLNVRTNRIAAENFVYFSESDNEGPLAKTRVWKDDVLLVRSGQPGTAAVVPTEFDGVNAIDILIVTPDLERVTSQYLCYLFNSPAGKRLVLGEQRGQIQKHLNVGSLKKLQVPLPPISEQRDFNRFLVSTATLQRRLADARSSVDALFNSLVQRAFKADPGF